MRSPLGGGRRLAVAIVHHANQYLLTEGYDDRPGIASVIGSGEARQGLVSILEMHREYGVPANVHISGTLLESIAWWRPSLLAMVRDMCADGLIEIVGSAYGQNVMRFFNHQHNVRQLNEQLDLYRLHLGIEPRSIRVFWPPERVWDTELMAPVVRDPALRNGGYEYVLIDDRVLLGDSARAVYDQTGGCIAPLFHAYRLRGGQDLVALPISTTLRQCIPPRCPEHRLRVEEQLRWLSSLDPDDYQGDFVAIYGDDMEKPAGVGWDPEGPAQFEGLLEWLTGTEWAAPVKLSEWAARSRIAKAVSLRGGTYVELAKQFDAGELYENWYGDERWAPYRSQYEWSEERVRHLHSLGADATLIELAEKHLLATSWETAWHTPAAGAHGSPDSAGAPGASMCAVASHSRHAAVIAEAAYWQRHKDDDAHAYLADLDNDGENELIVKNGRLFAVLAPQRGGRLIALFDVGGPTGVMLIGNPTDDWNLQKELNAYMVCPPNHPGALADVGFEHDRYAAYVRTAYGTAVHVQLRNEQDDSQLRGLTKDLRIRAYHDDVLHVEYDLPPGTPELSVEFGLSPDYLTLLRCGSAILRPFARADARGWSAHGATVWVEPELCIGARWAQPRQELFGHGRAIRLSIAQRQFAVSIGVERS